jgi:RimJ/RimL family protein N-acetyltransferase
MNPWPAPLATVLTGTRVQLEPLAATHADDLFAAGRDPEIWTWYGGYLPLERPVFDDWLDASLAASARGEEAAFATIDLGSGRAIGSTRFLTLRPEHRGLEIGWTWLHRPAWRTGVNVEVKLLQLTHAFETLGCLRVELKTNAHNERSRRAMEALPAQFEGILRRHMVLPNGRLRDSAYYSVIDTEWPAVKDNLNRRLGVRPGET